LAILQITAWKQTSYRPLLANPALNPDDEATLRQAVADFLAD
jgi:hypothetical protein